MLDHIDFSLGAKNEKLIKNNVLRITYHLLLTSPGMSKRRKHQFTFVVIIADSTKQGKQACTAFVEGGHIFFNH